MLYLVLVFFLLEIKQKLSSFRLSPQLDFLSAIMVHCVQNINSFRSKRDQHLVCRYNIKTLRQTRAAKTTKSMVRSLREEWPSISLSPAPWRKIRSVPDQRALETKAWQYILSVCCTCYKRRPFLVLPAPRSVRGEVKRFLLQTWVRLVKNGRRNRGNVVCSNRLYDR